MIIVRYKHCAYLYRSSDGSVVLTGAAIVVLVMMVVWGILMCWAVSELIYTI